jgi:enolase-phosphatase E1
MIKAIVTDIEGTTSSLSFVKEVLFPYAREHLPDFILTHQQMDEVETLLNDARNEMGGTPDIDQLISQFIDWIDRDQKITPLKAMQGLIWEAGYESGDFKGHIYADAALQLKAWKQQGYSLYVYSSGSVHAQKLLFAHTEFGDLTPLFSGYFDTRIGGKKQAESYKTIAEQIQCQPNDILFLSDIVDELDAAQAAGFQTYWLVRDQIELLDTASPHPQAQDFNAIQI